MTDETPRDYTENERRLLAIAVQRQMLLDAANEKLDTMRGMYTAVHEAAVEAQRRLVEQGKELYHLRTQLDARDKRLAAIAELAHGSIYSDGLTPLERTLKIEAIARG